MRIKSILIVIGLSVAGLLAGQGVAQARPVPPSYYLALGDSLSQGYMPGPGPTDDGYVDDLYAGLHSRNPALQLVKLGCPDETTTTMVDGGVCGYAAGSQLAAAEQFLRSHRGSVDYVTLDIGANDVDGCVSATGIDTTCVAAGLTTISSNLPRILAAIRTAGDSHTVVTAMMYYDPFLAVWLTGTPGQAAAEESVTITGTLNRLEAGQFTRFGFRVARVASAFKTGDFTDQVTLPGIGQVPVNVANICSLTYMCTMDNIHPNAAGYQLIAHAFTAAINRPNHEANRQQ